MKIYGAEDKPKGKTMKNNPVMSLTFHESKTGDLQIYPHGSSQISDQIWIVDHLYWKSLWDFSDPPSWN